MPAKAAEYTCLPKLICAIKDRVRWRTPAWTPQFCEDMAETIQDSSKIYGIRPELILAVMLNESEFREDSGRKYYDSNGKLLAVDSGLMGMRCVLGVKGKCVNGLVRGKTVEEIMNPFTNIDLGTHQLSMWKNGMARVSEVVKVKTRHGFVPKFVVGPCLHKDHAWWAHYNHGPRYISKGPSRHYPHRVAVLYAALVGSMGTSWPRELNSTITIVDKGYKPKTLDRPVGERQQKLAGNIRASNEVCSRVLTSAVWK